MPKALSMWAGFIYIFDCACMDQLTLPGLTGVALLVSNSAQSLGYVNMGLANVHWTMLASTQQHSAAGILPPAPGQPRLTYLHKGATGGPTMLNALNTLPVPRGSAPCRILPRSTMTLTPPCATPTSRAILPPERLDWPVHRWSFGRPCHHPRQRQCGDRFGDLFPGTDPLLFLHSLYLM